MGTSSRSGNQGRARALITPERQCEARQSANETEYGAFGHELPDQTPSSGSHCDPDCGLSPGGCCPRQEQVRDVRAGNQQDGSDGCEHDEDCKAGVANDVLFERMHQDDVIGHSFFIKLQREPVHILARLIQRDIRAQPAQDSEKVSTAASVSIQP